MSSNVGVVILDKIEAGFLMVAMGFNLLFLIGIRMVRLAIYKNFLTAVTTTYPLG